MTQAIPAPWAQPTPPPRQTSVRPGDGVMGRPSFDVLPGRTINSMDPLTRQHVYYVHQVGQGQNRQYPKIPLSLK